MKFLGLLGKVGLCLILCAGLASADSLQLRNGRRLQGKYIGGTSTAIGFMSGASVEYFATTDVLVIMFDGAADSALDGTPTPSPMSGHMSTVAPPEAGTDTPNHSCSRESSQRSVSIRGDHRSQTRRKTLSALRPNCSLTGEDRGWPAAL